MKLKIAVTGKNGQVGMSLQEIAPEFKNYEITFWGRNHWDITDEAETKRIIGEGQYDVLINTAAYTAVDKAEDEVELCHEVNHLALDSIVDSCNKTGTHLIHLSSDYVYDNNLFRPLKTTDPCKPKGQYAISKLRGEKVILSKSNSASIIRTSWIYSSHGHNFVKTMLRLADQHDTLKVVQDQWGCPTSAHMLARDLLSSLIDSPFEPSVNIFNYTQSGFTNWYEFAVTVFQMSDKTVKVIPINSNEFQTKAERPKFSILDCTRFDERFQVNRPHWKLALKQCLLKLNED